MNGRSVLGPHWSSWGGWARSLPLALGVPAALWLLVIMGASLIEGENIGGAYFFTMIVVLYSVVIHLVMYALVGLPIFILGRLSDCAWIWRMPVAALLGVIAGVVPAGALATLIYGGDLYTRSGLMYVGIFGAYGLITGLAASRQRPPDEWTP